MELILNKQVETFLFMGGFISPAHHDVVDFVTVQTTGNATDFGDLTTDSR